MKYRLLCVLVVMLFAACTKEDTVINTEVVGPPSNVTIATIDTSSIRVSWARGENDVKPDTVMIMQDTTTVAAKETSKTETVTVVTGLHPGDYQIYVRSVGGNSIVVPWIILGPPGPPS